MAEGDALVPDRVYELIRNRVLGRVRSNAPAHINRIDATIVPVGGGKVSILFQVPITGAQADARAQEYGSGENKVAGRKGFKSKFEYEGKIIILPKKKKVLAFVWETADTEALKYSEIAHYNKTRQIMFRRGTGGELDIRPSFAGFSETDDRLLFNWVSHPGIKPYLGRGYMGISLKETKEENIADLKQLTAENIKIKLRANFTHIGKKGSSRKRIGL